VMVMSRKMVQTRKMVCMFCMLSILVNSYMLSNVGAGCLVEFLLFLFFRVPIWVVIPIWICSEYRRGLDFYMLMCVTVTEIELGEMSRKEEGERNNKRRKREEGA